MPHLPRCGTGSMTAVATLPRNKCPTCRRRLNTLVIHQPALFIDCGYGATERTTIRWCPKCSWSMVAERTETRPDREAS